MKRALPWILTVLVIAAVAYGGYRWKQASAVPDVAWKTVPAEKRKIAARVSASGTLQATVTVQVGAQVSGRIQKLDADFNSSVKKGQLVAKLDPQLFQAAMEQANANHLSARASVTRAEAQERDADQVLARARALNEQGLASGAELQTAQTGVSVAKAATEVARATLAQAAAALHQARVNLSYTDIFSPIDGTVISRNVDVGQTVASSLQAPVLFTIAEDLRKMQVHTSVAEGDVGRLQPGMDATFTVDAFPGQAFRGKVGQIRNAAQTVQNVVTYDAVIDVDNGDLRLRPGMTATVTVAFAERPDALAVPNSAFRFRPPPEASARVHGDPSGAPPVGSAAPGTSVAVGRRRPTAIATATDAADASDEGAKPPPVHAGTRKTLYVLRNGAPEALAVSVGLSDGTVSEILESPSPGGRAGLQPGDQVVVDATVAGKPMTAPGGGGAGGPGAPPRMGRMF